MLNLIQWAWSALKTLTTVGLTGPVVEPKGGTALAQLQDLSRVVFVCRVSMRLLRFYILELYPVKSKHGASYLLFKFTSDSFITVRIDFSLF